MSALTQMPENMVRYLHAIGDTITEEQAERLVQAAEKIATAVERQSSAVSGAIEVAGIILALAVILLIFSMFR
jgi:hypothetical protein